MQAITCSIFILFEMYPNTVYIRDANEGVLPSYTLYTKIQVHIISPTTLYHVALSVLKGAYFSHISLWIYYGFTTLKIISSLYQSTMAFVKLADRVSGFFVIRADGEGFSISFLLGRDGIAIITAICLSLRFQLNMDSLYIDEEVYDSVTRELSHIFGQLPVCNVGLSNIRMSIKRGHGHIGRPPPRLSTMPSTGPFAGRQPS